VTIAHFDREGASMNLMIYAAEINPMYYGTLVFLAFSSCFIIPGVWLVRRMKKEKKRQIGFVTAAPESRSRSAE
jgi:hypothetical protein